MFQIIESMINYTGGSNTYNYDSYIVYACICLILIFSVVFIDMIYRVFAHFWRNGK